MPCCQDPGSIAKTVSVDGLGDKYDREKYLVAKSPRDEPSLINQNTYSTPHKGRDKFEVTAKILSEIEKNEKWKARDKIVGFDSDQKS